MRYYFLNPKTFEVYDIYNGRSLWEDRVDKADFIVVKEIGPALEHFKEAMELQENVTKPSQEVDRLILENALFRQALGLIATPKRRDGTYNRSREACEFLAQEALTKSEK